MTNQVLYACRGCGRVSEDANGNVWHTFSKSVHLPEVLVPCVCENCAVDGSVQTSVAYQQVLSATMSLPGGKDDFVPQTAFVIRKCAGQKGCGKYSVTHEGHVLTPWTTEKPHILGQTFEEAACCLGCKKQRKLKKKTKGAK